MDNETIIAVLKRHSIHYTLQNGAVMALEPISGPHGEDYSEWVDLTKMTWGELSRWLGY